MDLKRFECLISRQCACRIPITPSSSPPSSNHLHKRDIFVFILFRDCYEMGHQKEFRFERDIQQSVVPRVRQEKDLTLPLNWQGLTLCQTPHTTCAEAQAPTSKVQNAEKHRRASLNTKRTIERTHAQTRRLSRNWTDRTRLATLAPHLTSAKSDTSKGPRSVITSIGIGYTLITYYQ